MSDVALLHGDCLEVMRTFGDATVDAVVCDPPYHLTSIVERFGKENSAPAKSDGATGVYARASRGFMGQTWDGGDIAFRVETWREVLRVLKPGGYLLAFSGTRTYHRMTVAIEDAGFQIRDCLSWQYGSGFPKSLAVEKNVPPEHVEAWKGWGTALKPAWEPIVVARKPLEGTVAGNVLKYGTGAINVDGCRVATTESTIRPNGPIGFHGGGSGGFGGSNDGRWPANVILSHAPDCTETCAPGCPCAALDAQAEGTSRYFNQLPIEADDLVPFVYAPKASRGEREEGCGDLEKKPGGSNAKGFTADVARGLDRNRPVRNHHPTVKPVSVMRHLIRLVTRKGGVVLDPFMGSGSTGIAAVREGVSFIGIEMSEEYLRIAEARVNSAQKTHLAKMFQ